jgi:toxin HigB-1
MGGGGAKARHTAIPPPRLVDKWRLSLYKAAMIRRFRDRGLRRLYQDDDRRGLNPEHVDKIARVLARLDQARAPEDMDLPGLRLHALRGDLGGFWSVTIRANWRVIFRFEGEDVTDVDYLDYH